MRKLFKGGKYSRAETIRGNTVCIFIIIYVTFLEEVFWSTFFVGSFLEELICLSRFRFLSSFVPKERKEGRKENLNV